MAGVGGASRSSWRGRAESKGEITRRAYPWKCRYPVCSPLLSARRRVLVAIGYESATYPKHHEPYIFGLKRSDGATGLRH